MNLDFINNFKCSKDNLTLWVRLATSQFLVTSRTTWPCLNLGQISRWDSLQSLMSQRRCLPTQPPQLVLHQEARVPKNISKSSLIPHLIMVRPIRTFMDKARELTVAHMSITWTRISIQLHSCTCMALLLTTTILRHIWIHNSSRAVWAPIVAIELPSTSPTCLLLVMKDHLHRAFILMPCIRDRGRKELLSRSYHRKKILMMIATTMWK